MNKYKNKDIITLNTHNQMIIEMYEILQECSDSVVITNYDNALKLIELLENDEDLYVIDRTRDNNTEYDIVFIKNIDDKNYIIQDLFNKNGDMKTVHGDIIMIEEGFITDEEIEENIYADELVFVDYDYDNDRRINEAIGQREQAEEECYCNDCNGNCGECEQNSEELRDMVEEYTMLIQDTDGCPHCISMRLLEFAIDILERYQTRFEGK